MSQASSMESLCKAQMPSGCPEGIDNHQAACVAQPPSTTSPKKLPSCKFLRQAWKDYKLGRKLRKQETFYDMRRKAGLPVHTDDTEQPNVPTYGPGWRFRWDKEYPWRIECTVPGDENWRGTWVLEVKDMSEINWVQQKVHDGRGWKEVALPEAPHWHTPSMFEDLGM